MARRVRDLPVVMGRVRGGVVVGGPGGGGGPACALARGGVGGRAGGRRPVCRSSVGCCRATRSTRRPVPTLTPSRPSGRGPDAESSRGARRDAGWSRRWTTWVGRPRRRSCRWAPGRGRFELRFSAPADVGALVQAAVAEARDALFAAGVAAGDRGGALVEVCDRSLGGVESPSRRDSFRVYVHLDAEGGWLNGAPRLPQHLVRKLTCEGTMQPLWERAGVPVSVGRALRIVPERTRRLVLDRDRGCRFPAVSPRRTCRSITSCTGPTVAGPIWTTWWRCARSTTMRIMRGEFGISGDANDLGGLVFTARAASRSVGSSRSRPTRPCGVGRRPRAGDGAAVDVAAGPGGGCWTGRGPGSQGRVHPTTRRSPGAGAGGRLPGSHRRGASRKVVHLRPAGPLADLTGALTSRAPRPRLAACSLPSLSHRPVPPIPPTPRARSARPSPLPSASSGSRACPTAPTPCSRRWRAAGTSAWTSSRRACEAVGAYGPRVSLVLKADIRPGYTGELTGKLDRLEAAIERAGSPAPDADRPTRHVDRLDLPRGGSALRPARGDGSTAGQVGSRPPSRR